MRKKAIFITGASGEVGQALIKRLAKNKDNLLVTMDLHPLPDEVSNLSTHIQGDILNKILLARIVSEYEIDTIYHLAALLSRSSEFAPEMAHEVNVEGTLTLLRLLPNNRNGATKPSSLFFPVLLPFMVYQKQKAKAFTKKYGNGSGIRRAPFMGVINSIVKCWANTIVSIIVNWRQNNRLCSILEGCVFPGLISAFTVPTGGTSDYAPEMIHAAAQGQPYNCFVHEKSRLPFMAMPDAARSLILLAEAPREKLSHAMYNVTSFSLAADEIRDLVLKAFPQAKITFESAGKPQTIVDSWPADLDDSAAPH